MSKTELEIASTWCAENTDLEDQIGFIKEEILAVHSNDSFFEVRVFLFWISCVYGKYIKQGTLPKIEYIPIEIDLGFNRESYNMIASIEVENQSVKYQKMYVALSGSDALENARNFNYAWSELNK